MVVVDQRSCCHAWVAAASCWSAAAADWWVLSNWGRAPAHCMYIAHAQRKARLQYSAVYRYGGSQAKPRCVKGIYATVKELTAPVASLLAPLIQRLSPICVKECRCLSTCAVG